MMADLIQRCGEGGQEYLSGVESNTVLEKVLKFEFDLPLGRSFSTLELLASGTRSFLVVGQLFHVFQVFSSISGLSSTRSQLHPQPSFPTSSRTIRNVSRHCQYPLGGSHSRDRALHYSQALPDPLLDSW